MSCGVCDIYVCHVDTNQTDHDSWDVAQGWMGGGVEMDLSFV